MQSAVEGAYPLARPLLMISRSDAEPQVEAYVAWVLSDEGQCILRRIGYAPVRPVVCG
jgi:phosphate transport system substrate-binding protein